MVAPVFADEELESLRRFREIGREELFRFFTLPPADSAFIDRGRGPADRLGLAVAVCTLPWPGFVPDDVAPALPTAVARLGEQLREDPEEIRSCRASGEDPDGSSAAGGAVSGAAGPATLELKELGEFLLARAMEHDSPSLSFRPVTRNTGLNSPLVSLGAVGCSSKSRPPAATRER